MTDVMLDLLIDFDEMGFAPTTTCPNPDKYACEWKEKLIAEINYLQEQLEAAIAGRETLQKALAEKNKELMDLNINLELLRIYGNKNLSYKIATLTAEKNRLTDMFCEYRQEAIRALDEKDIEIERLTTEKDRLIKTFGECQEEAVKDFAKAVIDGIDEGYISHSSDVIDFTADYLRGKGDTE